MLHSPLSELIVLQLNVPKELLKTSPFIISSSATLSGPESSLLREEEAGRDAALIKDVRKLGSRKLGSLETLRGDTSYRFRYAC